MRTIAALFAVLAFGGCATIAPIEPESVLGQIGAIVYSPSEPGWLLIQSDNSSIAFGKQYGSNDETSVANTVAFAVEGYKDDKAFLEYIAEQREKKNNNARFKALNITNEIVTFKEAPCLQYRTLSEDHKNSGIDSDNYQYFKTIGYVCRHPSNSAIAFQMEVSHRGNEEVFPAKLLSLGRHFFDSIQFADEFALPGDTLTHYNQGNIYSESGDYKSAIREYEVAITKTPTFAGAHYNKGNAYDDKGEYDMAIMDYSKAIQITPTFSTAYANKGRAYTHKGEYDEAIKYLDNAININPAASFMYLKRGYAYYRKGDLSRSIEDYTKAIKLTPKVSEAYTRRGAAYADTGNWLKACADYKQSCKLGDCSGIANARCEGLGSE